MPIFSFRQSTQPSQTSRTRTSPMGLCDLVVICTMLVGTAVFVTLYSILGTISLKATETVTALYHNLVPLAIHRAALLSAHTTTGLSPLIRRLPRRARVLIHKAVMVLVKCDARLFTRSVLAPRDGARKMFQPYVDMGRTIVARRGPAGSEYDASADPGEWARTTDIIARRWLRVGSTLQFMHRNYLYASRLHETWREVRGSWGVRFVVDERGEWAMPEGSLPGEIWQCAREADLVLYRSKLAVAAVLRHLLNSDPEPERRQAALYVWSNLHPLPAFDN